MGLFRLSAVLFVLATTSAASEHYILQHRAVVTDLSRCGDAGTLSDCLSELPDNNEQAVIGCFASAGCSSQDARDEVTFIVKRFGEFPVVRKIQKRATSTDDSKDNTKSDDSKDASTTDDKSKSDDTKTEKASSTKQTSDDATTTTDAKTTETSDKSTSASSRASSTVASSTTDSSTASSDGVMTGSKCFATQTKTTEFCQLHTTDGRTESRSCTEGKVSSSQCGPNLICTTNSGGDDICMKHQDIQTEGIVIAIIMALASIGVLGGTFFACLKGSRKQKRVEELLKGKDNSTASLIPK